MKCVKCDSPKVLKFIDGFGSKRVFCRGCGRSFLEGSFTRLAEQTHLHELRDFYKGGVKHD